MGQCACFGAAQVKKERRAEADRLEAKQARARATEVAQKRQEVFEKSAPGRAARTQMKFMKEAETSNQNKGDPILNTSLSL